MNSVFMFNDLVSFANEIGATPSIGDFAEDFKPSVYDFIEGQIFKDYVVYIRDFDSSQSRRFHLCCCQTIFEFIKYGRYGEQYKKLRVDCIKMKRSGSVYEHIFPVYFLNLDKGDFKALKPCKHCLEALNYKNYRFESERNRKKIYETFSIVDFIEEYKIDIPDTGDADDGLFNTYSEDWNAISFFVRSRAKWKCGICGTDYSQDRANLHVHHRNGNKRDNRLANLIALCKPCHQKIHNI